MNKLTEASPASLPSWNRYWTDASARFRSKAKNCEKSTHCWRQPGPPASATPLLSGLILFSLAWLLPTPAFSEKGITIHTASPAGVYPLAGRAICRLVEIPCLAEPSDGSSANLHALQRGEISLAFAQSDIHHYAANGTEGFQNTGPNASLRSVFSLHNEPFTLVVRRDAGIQNFDDIAQRSVNIGNPGSGQRGTMLVW